MEAGEEGTQVGSVMNQLEDTGREIKECYERLDFIESKLRRRYYPSEEKKRLEKEVKDIKSHLSRHENNLRSLRGENRVAMMLSVLLLALGALVYLVYRLVLT